MILVFNVCWIDNEFSADPSNNSLNVITAKYSSDRSLWWESKPKYECSYNATCATVEINNVCFSNETVNIRFVILFMMVADGDIGSERKWVHTDCIDRLLLATDAIQCSSWHCWRSQSKRFIALPMSLWRRTDVRMRTLLAPAWKHSPTLIANIYIRNLWCLLAFRAVAPWNWDSLSLRAFIAISF